MRQVTPQHNPRRGTALVEFAFVAVVLMLVLFGIFEYARFVMMLQVGENAAREGARMAVARTGDGTTKQDIIDEVTRRLASVTDLSGFTVDVVHVDPDTGTTKSTDWTTAAFGEAIEVRITGSYKPLLPTFLLTSSSISVKISSMMTSEAN